MGTKVIVFVRFIFFKYLHGYLQTYNYKLINKSLKRLLQTYNYYKLINSVAKATTTNDRLQTIRLQTYFRRSIPIVLSTYFSNNGSDVPFFILRRKYLSNAIFARCTHLPFLNQVRLRGGICGIATNAAPVSPISARQTAFQVPVSEGALPLISLLILCTMAVTIDSIM